MANLFTAPFTLLTSVQRQIWRWRNVHGPPLEPQTRPLKLRCKQDWALRDVHDQQCALFKTLPQDVRLIIWTSVLGAESAEDVIHLDLGHGSIRSRRCLKEGQLDELGFKHVCWDLAWSKGDRKLNESLIYMPGGRSLLSLLLTCKLVYTESIHLLYTSNVFDLRRAECLLRLPKVIAVQHVASIRSIRFSTAFYYPVDTSARISEPEVITLAWSPPDDAAKWPEACSIFAAMNLAHLSVTIALWTREPRLIGVDDDVQDSHFNILKPLTAARASNYRVALTAHVSKDVLSRLGTLPFTLDKDDTLDAGYEFGIHHLY